VRAFGGADAVTALAVGDEEVVAGNVPDDGVAVGISGTDGVGTVIAPRSDVVTDGERFRLATLWVVDADATLVWDCLLFFFSWDTGHLVSCEWTKGSGAWTECPSVVAPSMG
jgi:hypothetical protein